MRSSLEFLMVITITLVWISGVCNAANCAIYINYQACCIYTKSCYLLIVEKNNIYMWLKCFGTRLYTLQSIVMEGRTYTSDIPDYQELTLHLQQHS